MFEYHGYDGWRGVQPARYLHTSKYGHVAVTCKLNYDLTKSCSWIFWVSAIRLCYVEFNIISVPGEREAKHIVLQNPQASIDTTLLYFTTEVLMKTRHELWNYLDFWLTKLRNYNSDFALIASLLCHQALTGRFPHLCSHFACRMCQHIKNESVFLK